MESTAINLAGGSSCFCFHITARLISQISFSICPNIVPSQEAVRAHGFVSWVFIINISCMLANTSPVGFHPKQANEEAKEQISPPVRGGANHLLLLFLLSTMLSSASVLVLIHKYGSLPSDKSLPLRGFWISFSRSASSMIMIKAGGRRASDTHVSETPFLARQTVLLGPCRHFCVRTEPKHRDQDVSLA